MLIINGVIYCENRKIEAGYVHIVDEKIAAIGSMAYCTIEDTQVIDAKGHAVIPGFIDQHIHGANGTDHMDGDEASLSNIAKFLPKEGTTSYLPTTMTQSPEAIERALVSLVDYIEHKNMPGEAHMLGIHLEGPFISEHHVGAQNPIYLQKPTKDNFDHYYDIAKGHMKLIAFAPEEAEAGFIDHVTAKGVVASAAHTDAYYDQIMQAAKEGLTNLTHFHNAMTPHHHRNPGAVTAGFVNPQLKAEMIVDGVHIHPHSVNATYLIKGDEGVIAITDSMRAKGLPDGQYDLGGQIVTKVGKECRIETGSLAGSVAEMDFVVRNLKQFTNCSMESLIKMSSTNSAKQLGVFGRKGSIAIGKDADIVIVDEDIHVLATICRGVLAYRQ